HRRANPGEDEHGDKVRLMERIHVGVSGHVATHTQEPEFRAISQAKVRHAAVLDMLVLGGIGQKVGPTLAYGKKPLQLLGEGLRTEKRRLEKELREVGSLNGAIARDNLSTEQVLRRDRVRKFVVLMAPNVGHVVQVGTRLCRQRTARIVGEVHVAHQRSPVVLDLLGCGLGASDARCGRDDGGMGVESFQVEGQSALWSVQGPGEIGIARTADDDVLEVREPSGREGIYQALPSGRVWYAEVVVLQAFAPVAAEVGELLLIAIVR